MEILINDSVNEINDYNYGLFKANITKNFIFHISLKQMLQKFYISEFSNKFEILKGVLKIYQCEQKSCFRF